MPVQRIWVPQNRSFVRKTGKVTVCDACAADLRCRNPNFGGKVTVCDACAADLRSLETK